MRSRLADALLIVVMILVAVTPLWPIYRHPQVVVVVLGAVVLGAAIAIAGGRWRWPAHTVVAVTAVVYLIGGVGLAVPASAGLGVLPTIDGLRRLVVGTALSWKQMLSVALPLGAYEALLVPVLVVVLVATTGGLSIVLRAARPDWALLAPAVVYLFGIVFGSAVPFWPLASGAALVSFGMLWAIRRGGGPAGSAAVRVSRGDRLRRWLAAGVLVAVCVAGGTALAGVSPSTVPRQVARSAVQPPFDVHDHVSPLIGFRNSVLPPGSDEAAFTVIGMPAHARIRLAVLDDYDGLVFAAGGQDGGGAFERVPLRVERDREPQGTAASVRFRIDALSGVWLPSVSALGSIRFAGASADRSDDFFYDRGADAAALLGGVTRGLEYTVDGVIVADPTDEQLAALRPGGTRKSGAGDVPDALVDAAGGHSGDGAPGRRLLAVADWLRSGYVSDSGRDEPFSRPGHSADRLASLVADSPMLGDAEQYAPALALMARELGFPSRVVLGYVLKAASDAGDEVAVHGSDLTAWVEVQDRDGVWSAVDPNPPRRESPKEERTSTDAVARPQTVPPPPPPTKQDAVSSPAGADGEKDDRDAVPEWLGVLWTVLGVVGVAIPLLALVLAPLWATALVRLLLRCVRRRRDRRKRSLAGAWDEVADRIAELDGPVSASATRREVAAIAPTALVLRLAERADRAVFDTEELTDAEVERFWAEVRTARVSVVEGASRRERLRLAVSWRAIGVRLWAFWTEWRKK